MPRIDPLQLLKCLSVLLSPDGGILSRDEVPRLVNLMTKFSKKLVSKSIYVLILKNTDTSLVDMFMAEGGWTLIQTWIQDAVLLNNWVLVKEILELLLVTPVDVERLKMNCLPKLIKSLSRRDDVDGVAQLSDQIVQKWLTIVKGTAPSAAAHPQPEVAPQSQISVKVETVVKVEMTESTANDPIKQEPIKQETEENVGAIKPASFYKAVDKESKPIDRDALDTKSTLSEPTPVTEKEITTDQVEVDITKKTEMKKEKLSKSLKSSSSSSSKRDKEKDKHRSSHSSSKSKSSREKDHKDKERSEKDKDRGDKGKDRNDKDKSKDRKDRDKSRDKDKDRHSSSKSSSRSSSSHSKDSKDKSREKVKSKDKEKEKDKSKDFKETQAEKDKDTLAKIKPPTIDKLGRIPKKSGSNNVAEEKEKSKEKDIEKDIKKKPAFSILDKKKEGEERAKTVKVFNSKMRSTGLEEEVKPPPPRNALKKPTPSVQLPTIPQKRPSPIRDLPSSVPPEKKIKIDKVDVPERPGAIKLIPPKPKPMLQESDMFMDALSASVTKKPAKRKRRASQSKELPSSPTSSPATTTEPITPTSPTITMASPTMKNIAPINFYQDTLTEETEPNSEESKEDDKENSDVPTMKNNTESPASPGNPVNQVEAEEEEVPSKVPRLNEQGLRGVLLYSKKKGPKRSIQWKSEEDLVEVRYFELDETERVNVTKTFTDMAKMEMSSEREAMLTCRKPSFDDTMEPQVMWRLPILCEQPEASAVPGSKSLEKDIQFAREKSVLQALYFDKRRIPDSPEEPIPENHQMSDPVMIPLDDPEGQVTDLRTTPWPEPKGMPVIEPQQLPPVFNQNISFNPNYIGPVPPQFGPPRFGPPVGPQMPPISSGNFGPPVGNMMRPPNMMPPPEIINQGYIPGPHEGYPGPDGYPPGAPPFIGPPNVGPPNMNMYGPPGNFNNYRGPPRGVGNFRRGNNQQGGWVRLSAPTNNWKRGGGARGPNNNRVCKNISNHGFCRNIDNCQWFHPQ